jgi:hypothetical protein
MPLLSKAVEQLTEHISSTLVQTKYSLQHNELQCEDRDTQHSAAAVSNSLLPMLSTEWSKQRTMCGANYKMSLHVVTFNGTY